MPYARIEKSGCEIHKNRLKLRLDFYLNPTEPNYSKYYLYLVDENSQEFKNGYQGDLDEYGNPVNFDDYKIWLDSLPHIWKNTPFHTHFIYPEKEAIDITIIDQIKQALLYFYQFRQTCWSAGKDFMNEWAKVPKIKGTVRDIFIAGKSIDIQDYENKLADILSRIDQFNIMEIKI